MPVWPGCSCGNLSLGCEEGPSVITAAASQPPFPTSFCPPAPPILSLRCNKRTLSIPLLPSALLLPRLFAPPCCVTALHPTAHLISRTTPHACSSTPSLSAASTAIHLATHRPHSHTQQEFSHPLFAELPGSSHAMSPAPALSTPCFSPAVQRMGCASCPAHSAPALPQPPVLPLQMPPLSPLFSYSECVTRHSMAPPQQGRLVKSRRDSKDRASGGVGSAQGPSGMRQLEWPGM